MWFTAVASPAMNAPAAPILSAPPALIDAAGATPVMAQYFDAKAKQPDALIFFRMGDFYELFFEDAAKAGAAIGIAVTHRGTHAGQPIPMAGVPVHAAEAYLARLIRAGFKVAVCEQMEDPATAKKRGAKALVRRELVRVVTPGTLTEDTLLEAKGANRLAAVAVRAGQAAVASVDISTGEVECLCLAVGAIASALAAMKPSEVLVSERLFADVALSAALKAVGGALQPMANALAEPSASEARLKRLYGVATLDALGQFTGAEISALGLIAAHLETTQAGRLPALRAPRRGLDGEVMAIDPATRVGLELERSVSGRREGSLLAAIDRTVTSAGGRLIASRLASPLTDPNAINARLDSVAWLMDHTPLRERLRTVLKNAPDISRAFSRLALGRGGPRDFGCLADGLAACATLGALFDRAAEPLMPPPGEIAAALRAMRLGPRLAALVTRLNEGLAGELPAQTRDGGFVAAGVCDDLDGARDLRDESRKVIAVLEARLARESGVPLKIRHNAVLGYFIEATVRHAEPLFQAPLAQQFLHRQTLANQARFTTLELAGLGAAIAQAGQRALALELSVFERWREEARSAATEIHDAAEGLARVDVAAALAQWASEENAVRPCVDLTLVFEARSARHPVVESAVRRAGEGFTANDCMLDGSGDAAARLSIVTGPNMAGKSTFLRQNALLAVLAQAGCFVPAKSLRLGVVDRLFSRVGAGDDLARGRSTFMAEMVETAAILLQATPRSLVILDEIGRGTATYDGLAIAWACAEALHDANRCRTLFATHYHELAALESRLAHVCNLSMTAKEWKGELVFLHEAAPGAADRSYGVHVAKLAGVPPAVVARARQVLDRLENQAAAHAGLEELPLFAAFGADDLPPPGPGPLHAALAELDLDGMSPREAMDALYRLKGLL